MRRKVKRGETLVREGDAFSKLFAIRSGFFKTLQTDDEGRAQINAFPMAGDHIGLDGIATGRHALEVVALDDAEVCVIPFERVEVMSREVPSIQRHMYRILSREIVRESSLMMAVGGLSAEAKIAQFLLGLTHRLQARGYSPSEFVLRMSREEIGSFLCLQLETVSRTLSKFAAKGIIEIRQRHVHVLNAGALNLASPLPAMG